MHIDNKSLPSFEICFFNPVYLTFKDHTIFQHKLFYPSNKHSTSTISNLSWIIIFFFTVIVDYILHSLLLWLLQILWLLLSHLIILIFHILYFLIVHFPNQNTSISLWACHKIPLIRAEHALVYVIQMICVAFKVSLWLAVARILKHSNRSHFICHSNLPVSDSLNFQDFIFIWIVRMQNTLHVGGHFNSICAPFHVEFHFSFDNFLEILVPEINDLHIIDIILVEQEEVIRREIDEFDGCRLNRHRDVIREYLLIWANILVDNNLRVGFLIWI